MMFLVKPDREAIDRIIGRFEEAADNEHNYAIVSAAVLFIANIISEADMRDKEQFVDSLAESIKKYLRVTDARERKTDA